MPVGIRARYALPGPIEQISYRRTGGTSGLRFYAGELRSGPESASFHLILPGREDDGQARPFIVALPILAGGKRLMWIVGSLLARRGFAVAWADRVGGALKTGQRPWDLEILFRRTVIHNRMLLRWARGQAWANEKRLGCLGISMGGIVAGVLLAAEPSLQAGALVLAGGNLPELVLASKENRVRRWRHWRRLEDGISSAELRRELHEYLLSDPALLGAYVATEKVVLVGAALDTVVPPRTQDELWESLGRPRRLLLPLAHYTSVLALNPIVSTVATFMRQRFATLEPGPGRK